MSRYSPVFFDLDGTLTDPGEGITRSVAYALHRFGIEVTDRRALYPFIGPPLLESFAKYYSFTPEQARQAVTYYREYFRTRGIFENRVYDGVPELLGALRQAGVPLVLATCKPEPFARQILDHFGLAEYFSCVAAATMGEARTHKEEVLTYALTRCPPGAAHTGVMVGDRALDVRGAAAVGLPCIGVLYGYGSGQELQQAGTVATAATPEALLPLLL